jgi:hypothetical protein
MPRQKITYQPTFKGHSIQTDAKHGLGCIENMLEPFHERLTYMVSKYQQVSAMELVVTPPRSVTPNKANKVVAEAVRTVRRAMSKAGVESQVCWTRELGKDSAAAGENRPHYNINILTDGSRCQSAGGVAKHLRKLLVKKSNDENDPGNVHWCPPDKNKNQQDLHPKEIASAIKIRQDKPHADKQFDNVFNRQSYNCKCDQKGQTGPRQREFGFSRIPKG